MYTIKIDSKVKKDLAKIDTRYQKIILEKIKTTLTTNPYLGKKLAGPWGKYHRLRVANYRIIYQIFESEIIVEVIKIAHRAKVYKK
jgi:mRNA interferase RelE/StbE